MRLRDQALRLAHCRVGRRGAALLFFGVLDWVYAWSMVTADERTVAASVTYTWFSTIAPMEFWAAIWGVVGAVCLYYAFQRFDRRGFGAAIGIKVIWGLLSLVGAILDDVTVGSVGVWLGLAALVAVIAGWPEPHEDSRGRA